MVLRTMLFALLVAGAGYFLLQRFGLFAETVVVTSSQGSGSPTTQELRMVTLLPKDGIPAILEPKFNRASEAQAEMLDGEQVLGVSIKGEHRAYSTALLSRHEIVNDVVGGQPIAVTW